MWKIQLIKLYCTVCQHYNNGISQQVQRLSNNFRPKFTDQEIITIYLWGIIQRKFQTKAIYEYTKMHLLDWFPELPSYQAFNRRLGELSSAFSALAECLLEEKPMEANDMNILIIDSMPVILAKASRSGSAKVAREICGKTYNKSRDQWYYGMKIHALGQKRRDTLPFPKCIFASKASQHDISAAKEILENAYFPGFSLVGDKAYCDSSWKETLVKAGIKLVTPTKLQRGEAPPLKGGSAADTFISRTRQPIESLFNWLHEKTNIQSASKVRSIKGLLLHIFGRIAAALVILLGLVNC